MPPNLTVVRPKYVIKRASQLGEWGVNCILYGPPGVGKTTLAVQAADCEYGAPVLVVDAEGGARAFSHREDIYVASVTDEDRRGFAELKDIYGDLEKRSLTADDGAPFKTIIVDNLSEITSMCVNHIVRTVSRNVSQADRPDLHDWQDVTAEMLTFVRNFRDYARNTGTNVFFIAWDRVGETTQFRELGVNPALAQKLPGVVDIVGVLRVKGKDRREVSFEASNSTRAKFRRSGAEAANQVPTVIEYQFGTHRPMIDILNTLKGGMPWPTAKYASPRTNESK